MYLQNGRYLAIIMDDSVTTCDEIIEETVPTNFNEKKATQNFYILLVFLLITIALLIAVSIKQNKNFYYHFTTQITNYNNETTKDISIKNHTYYVFDDIINIKNFHINYIKIDEKS